MRYEVDTDAFNPTYVMLVTPDAENGDLHAQLISAEKSDKVHPISGLDELLHYRLGYDGDSKRCFALIQEHEDGTREIKAAIYTHWSDQPEEDDSWKMLPGHIDTIKQERSRKLEGEPTVVTFFSISSFGKGAGKKLISTLHTAFTGAANPPILTTLSPLRSLGGWLEEGGRMLGDTFDDMVATVAEFLSLREDPVQNFHLGNGAQVGAIHFNASASGPDADDGAGCMISYRYPRKPGRLDQNKGEFDEGAIPVSNHLKPWFN